MGSTGFKAGSATVGLGGEPEHGLTSTPHASAVWVAQRHNGPANTKKKPRFKTGAEKALSLSSR
jgi:hypothetical protein